MLKKLNEGFQYMLDQGDPRVKHWPMMKTPFPGLAMIVAYVYFVKVAGPQFMEKRKPFQLRMPMVFYNFLMVLGNLCVFLGIGHYGWFTKYSLKCQPVDYSNNVEAVRVAQFGYLFYILKFMELSDTVFFVLRKKYNQISTLHVVHHSIVPLSLWFGIKYTPGGHHSLFAFMNSFVHVIMYSYYGLAAMGEKYKKYLFWKKYMTYIQLAQFVVIIIHSTSLYINNCDKSYVFTSLNFFHAVLFFGLFVDFFVKTYRSSKLTRKSLSSSVKPQLCTKQHATLNGNDVHKTLTNGQLKHRNGYTDESKHGNVVCLHPASNNSEAANEHFCLKNGSNGSTSARKNSNGHLKSS